MNGIDVTYLVKSSKLLYYSQLFRLALTIRLKLAFPLIDSVTGEPVILVGTLKTKSRVTLTTVEHD